MKTITVVLLDLILQNKYFLIFSIHLRFASNLSSIVSTSNINSLPFLFHLYPRLPIPFSLILAIQQLFSSSFTPIVGSIFAVSPLSLNKFVRYEYDLPSPLNGKSWKRISFFKVNEYCLEEVVSFRELLKSCSYTNFYLVSVAATQTTWKK